MRLLCFLAALLLFVGASVVGATVGVARAQDASPSKEERVERIRRLPPEEKRRLKEALARFSALPAAERDALRKKAREVGPERLTELAGRDFPALKARHARLQREMAEVMSLLGGPERFAAMSAQEREFVRDEAVRRFQEHCRISLLAQAQIGFDFSNVPHAERRERLRRATDAAIERMLAEKTPAEQNRVRALTGPERRRERAALLAAWRMRETVAFAKKFESNALRRFLEMPPEARREHVRRTVRWFHLAGLLRADGVTDDAMRMLFQLRADDKTLVALEFEQVRALSRDERRARIEAKIRELDGARSLDPERARRPLPRLREIFQRERDRDRRGFSPPASPAGEGR
jgi:hypothetical protein